MKTTLPVLLLFAGVSVFAATGVTSATKAGSVSQIATPAVSPLHNVCDASSPASERFSTAGAFSNPRMSLKDGISGRG